MRLISLQTQVSTRKFYKVQYNGEEYTLILFLRERILKDRHGNVVNDCILINKIDNFVMKHPGSQPLSYYKQKICLILEAAPNFKPNASELTEQLDSVLNSAIHLSEEEKDVLWSYILENRQKMFNHYIVQLNNEFYWLDEKVQKFEDGSRIIKLTPTNNIY